VVGDDRRHGPDVDRAVVLQPLRHLGGRLLRGVDLGEGGLHGLRVVRHHRAVGLVGLGDLTPLLLDRQGSEIADPAVQVEQRLDVALGRDRRVGQRVAVLVDLAAEALGARPAVTAAGDQCDARREHGAGAPERRSG
jgi:hypothetical protein